MTYMANENLKRFYEQAQEDYIEMLQNRHQMIMKKKYTKGYLFGIWYFKLIENKDENEIFNLITDGSGDKGIDAIYFDEDDKTIKIYQFKSGKTIDKGDILKFIEGIEFFRDFIGDKIKKEELKNLNDKLKKKFTEIRDIILNDEETEFNIFRFKIILVTNAQNISDENRDILKKYEISWKKQGAPVNFEIILGSDLFKKFMNSIYGVSLGNVETKIKKLEFLGPEIEGGSENEDNRINIHSGIITGIEIAKLYEKYRERLLEKNVRIYRPSSLVNDEIYKTASLPGNSNPFLYYNNGITIVTEELLNYGQKISLLNPQIVNGGQTIRTLYKAYKNKKLNPNVLVQLRIIVIGKNSELASQISIKLNTQTNIENQDIISSVPVILLLEQIFKARGYFLERRKDEFSIMSEEEKENLAKKLLISRDELDERIIPFKELLQYVSITIRNKVIQVKREYSKFMNEEILNEIFNQIQDLSPEDLISIYYFSKTISDYIGENKILKRQKFKVSWHNEFDSLDKKYSSLKPRSLIANSNLFVQSLLYHYYINKKGINVSDLAEKVTSENGHLIFMEGIEMILRFTMECPESKNTQWRTLLIRSTFFENVVSWVENNWDSIPKTERIIIF